MYKSPIRTAVMHSDITAKVNEDVDGIILSSVVRCGVSVDKEELLRALRYDRGQYDKGYADGKAEAMDGLVRCKDCIWFAPNNEGSWYGCAIEINSKEDEPKENDFCSFGERKSE